MLDIIAAATDSSDNVLKNEKCDYWNLIYFGSVDRPSYCEDF